ncbi:ABC transporter ATP-binding protein [Chelatococcus asaccharovorans]|uniref:ABC transporter ATP-binding protein n=1 Tax=Chelatococcus asaccharovorans TaxID=28210 RepID=UPI00224C6F35|nr:ABC transporter ATP-binding protein [Chelatococcus asaccharovorans]CAH1665911.1 branched chain amino acid/phenylalanine ABC transporter ATP binding subunit LivF [Chelatococcus asaccharovorans]CAH1681726.1 branched chain amino acid/phenylalanine ABC transporter ATP binding subunit LivF [Chelatococcus asaccharovorans]
MLTIEKLSAGYGRADVIHNLDMKVHQGQLVCLIGGNGAGKTTTLRTISGMLRPSGGRVLLDGHDLRGLPSHRVSALGLAHVPEGRKLFGSLSVMDNLRLGAFARKDRARGALSFDLDFVLEVFPLLRERRSQQAGTLSGGEQQMLAIARALMARPQVMVLDEPSLGLAPKLIAEVYTIIARLRAEGRTMVIVEQFANLALAVADHAYVMANGCIVREGPARQLRDDESVRNAYLGGHPLELA